MSNPKPRRWFQIHLSTAIVVMFVAGGILFLNLRARPGREPVLIYKRGWPWTIQVGNHNWQLSVVWAPNEFALMVVPKERIIVQPPSLVQGEWQLRGVVLNCVTALAFLSFAAIAQEFLIRRREARAK